MVITCCFDGGFLNTKEYLEYKNGEKDILKLEKKGESIYRGDVVKITEKRDIDLDGEVGFFEVVSQTAYDKETGVFTMRLKYIGGPSIVKAD